MTNLEHYFLNLKDMKKHFSFSKACMQCVVLFKAPHLDLAIFVCVTTPLDNTIQWLNHYPADKY